MITVYDPNKPALSVITGVAEYIQGLPWAAGYDVRPQSIPVGTKDPLVKPIITVEEMGVADKAIGFNDYMGCVDAPDGSVIEIFGRWQEIELAVDIWTDMGTGGSEERAIINGHLQKLNHLSAKSAFLAATGVLLVGFRSGQNTFEDNRYRMDSGSLELKALFTDEVTYIRLREIFVTSEDLSSGEQHSVDITA